MIPFTYTNFMYCFDDTLFRKTCSGHLWVVALPRDYLDNQLGAKNGPGIMGLEMNITA